MYWTLTHEDLEIEPSTNEAQSRSYVYLDIDGTKVKISDTVIPQNHILGSKKALMDAAYKLQNLSRQMISKAEKIK
jgi:hypothetical protein